MNSLKLPPRININKSVSHLQNNNSVMIRKLKPYSFSISECPRQKTSPGKRILCYTEIYEIEPLEDSICSCTILVHHGHDLQNLALSRKYTKHLKIIINLIEI